MTKRYQDEIEEILKKAGDLPSEAAADVADGKGRLRGLRRIRGRRWGLNYKHVLLAGFATLIASIFVEGWPILIAGAGLLVAGYAMCYLGPRERSGGGGGGDGSRQVKMWRGRPISSDDDPHFRKDPWGDSRG